jgi:hypothetical protein
MMSARGVGRDASMPTDTNVVIVWFEEDPDGSGPLLEQVEDADVVLIGEASHGLRSSADSWKTFKRRCAVRMK